MDKKQEEPFDATSAIDKEEQAESKSAGDKVFDAYKQQSLNQRVGFWVDHTARRLFEKLGSKKVR